jgi:hypothetical protein
MTELDFSMCPQGRRSTRVMSKGRACLVINLDLKPKRVPLWYAKILSGSHLTEMLALICSASLRLGTQ